MVQAKGLQHKTGTVTKPSHTFLTQALDVLKERQSWHY